VIRETLATQFMEPIPTTPAQFRAKIDADLARWSPVIKALEISKSIERAAAELVVSPYPRCGTFTPSSAIRNSNARARLA
jgi:hypothetical protein